MYTPYFARIEHIDWNTAQAFHLQIDESARTLDDVLFEPDFTTDNFVETEPVETIYGSKVFDETCTTTAELVKEYLRELERVRSEASLITDEHLTELCPTKDFFIIGVGKQQIAPSKFIIYGDLYRTTG